jgi:putative addiction module component (TIGR02574 family)
LSEAAIQLYIRSMSTITLSDLLHLSVPERLQLVEDLWDSIAAEAAAEPDRLPLDSSLRQELRRRSEADRQNPHEAIPLDNALDDIERSLG